MKPNTTTQKSAKTGKTRKGAYPYITYMAREGKKHHISGIGSLEIPLYDENGARLSTLRYDEKDVLDMGFGETMSIADALRYEEKKIEEINKNNETLVPLVRRLSEAYPEDYDELVAKKAGRLWHKIAKENLREDEVLDLMNAYYMNPKVKRTKEENEKEKELKKIRDKVGIKPQSAHAKNLDTLLTYVLGESRCHYSDVKKSLICYTLNLALYFHKDETRKNGMPYFMHVLNAARSIGNNFGDYISIIGGVMHDVLENRLDGWLKEKCREKFGSEKIGKRRKLEVLAENMDEFNRKSAEFYYDIGLKLFSHMRNLKSWEGFKEDFDSMMSVIAGLSRTPNTSYYGYCTRLLYGSGKNPDTITGQEIEEILCQNPFSKLGMDPRYKGKNSLDVFIEDIEKSHIKGSEIRNDITRLLVKIVDRLNNVRDTPYEGVTISARNYALFKSFYLIQAAEEKLRKLQHSSTIKEMNNIQKFMTKLKVAVLYQALINEDAIRREIGEKEYRKISKMIDGYRSKPEFWKVTSLGHDELKGTLDVYNEKMMGKKESIESLEKDRIKLAAHACVFRAIAEAYTAYPAMVHKDMAEKCRIVKKHLYGFSEAEIKESRYRWYKISGMGPPQERKSGSETDDIEGILSFRRDIIN